MVRSKVGVLGVVMFVVGNVKASDGKIFAKDIGVDTSRSVA